MSDAPAGWVFDVTEANFQEQVLDASLERPVLVDFWAPWCGPCQALGPVLERLVNERKGAVLLARVNTDEAPGLADYFQISAIPAIKIFSQGQLVHEFEGVLPEQALYSLLDQLAPGSGGDPRLRQARSLEARRPAEAERLYRQVVAQDADNAEARVGLARALLAQNKTDEIQEVLAEVPSEGEPGAEAERLKSRLAFAELVKDLPDEKTLRARIAADPGAAGPRYELGALLAARGEYAPALQLLLEAAERDMKLATGKAREVMVKIFYALGANHPLSNEYRSKLARLLY
jgi:putative thioredoxin